MKKVLKVIANILAWIVLVLALLVTVLVFSSGRNNGVANLFGFIPLTVESDSMLPTFAQGDLIICHEINDINALQENDVITFWTIIDGQKVKNTHRIVAVNEFESTRSFVTRGDNNVIDDEIPAYAGDLIGKWTNVKLTGMGKVMAFLRTKTGFFICILIPMALFFLLELYKFIAVLIEVKTAEAAPELDEEEIKRRAIEEYLAEQKKNDASDEDAAPEKAPATETAAPEEAPTDQPTPEDDPEKDAASGDDTASADEDTPPADAPPQE